MKVKKVLCLIVLILLGCVNAAFAKTTVDFSAGDRKDELNFNFAGDTNGQNPNVLSELKWTNLKMSEVRMKGKTDINDKSFLEGSMGYGWSHSGHNQDSDYSGDNRTGMFSRSENNSGHGHAIDASIGYGYYINKEERSKIALLVGYSVNKQSLLMTDGNQVFSDFVYQHQPIGPFPGLNSSFDARWNGPYIGLSFEKKANDKLNLFTRIEYHLTQYYAEGNWNLSSAYAHPKSLEQIASGSGTVFIVGAEHKINKEWDIKAQVNFYRFSSKNGLYRAFFADGTTGETHLNEANWNSQSINLTVTKSF